MSQQHDPVPCSHNQPERGDSWLLPLLSGLLVLLLFLLLNLLTMKAPDPVQMMTEQERRNRALIGGPYTLVNHRGETVTDKSFLGRYQLIYFGYTFCPDVCPTELQSMTTALDMIGDKAKEVVPIFITVDPERDTPPQLASYVSNFSPHLIGLTGTVKQVEAAKKVYRVYASKVKDENSSAAYLMDHSSIIYLMDRQGKFLTHFSYGTKPQEIAASLKRLIR